MTHAPGALPSLETRTAIERLEAEVVRRHLRRPDDLTPPLLDGLRYVLSFAKLGIVRNEAGQDIDLRGRLVAHHAAVVDALTPPLTGRDDSAWSAVRQLPALVAATRRLRSRILDETELDRDSLEAEVTTRQLVVVCSGGGGAGYGYAGAFRALHHAGLQPELLAGTSMGALMCMFRARLRPFDGAPLVAAARRLSWTRIFRVLEMDSRYGVPASLRLYLRAALGSLFQLPDGRYMTFRDTAIPLLIATTGITVEGLRHDLGYYEHFLDDSVQPGVVFKGSRIRRLAQISSIVREFLATPEALREIIFGADELTRDADVLDAAGFSAAVPGVIHYDVVRDDARMRGLLDQLYAQYGITRLTEGGLVNNLPCRPAWQEVMRGRITRRNPFVLGLNCFSPTPRMIQWLPVMQVVAPNVKANARYAHFVLNMDKRLSPMSLVPTVSMVGDAMQWTVDELTPHLPSIQEFCRPLRVLADR